jgi:hypothetical protein
MGRPDAMPEAAVSGRARLVCANLKDPSERYGTHDAGGLQGFIVPNPAARSPKERYTQVSL